ncbi:hypothetical protein H2200_007512 [Cladophialophora chaetospira]|uniref:Acyl-CoA oxidase C-terminal domain-containing protein n=1 Tax=Cladophialophora chaetospira TaxID=386627 RepID=A0AA38X846_9EURO|nr:hypothetical protein H2200_007512 [Cladophialophora chaetospira]
MQQRLKITSAGAWSSPETQEDVLELRAALIAQRHLSDVAEGKDTSYDVVELNLAHADLTYCRALQAQLEHAADGFKRTLKTLANLVALTAIIEGLAAFAGADFLSRENVSDLRVAHKDAISAFSGDLDAVMEAFGFTEYELNSVFARSDQTPYEGLLEVAKKSELTDNTFIRPTLLEARSLWKKYGRAKM